MLTNKTTSIKIFYVVISCYVKFIARIGIFRLFCTVSVKSGIGNLSNFFSTFVGPSIDLHQMSNVFVFSSHLPSFF